MGKNKVVGAVCKNISDECSMIQDVGLKDAVSTGKKGLSQEDVGGCEGR